MSNILRDFQIDLRDRIYDAWRNGARNVMAVAPTGSGKTTLFTHIIQELRQPTVIIAHRNELVSQAALALNRAEIPHGIIAPESTIQQIISLETVSHGKSHYHARAPVRAAGVDTLGARGATDKWFDTVRLVVQDEAHHVMADNKWGKAHGLFIRANGLFVTAHALRADGLGLGRAASGLVDALVIGPSCRELINRGFLSDYRLICADGDIDLSAIDVSASTGDYSAPQLRAAVHKSPKIVGDVVKQYLRWAKGKLGVTFAVDVESAEEIARAYQAQGVNAAVITAKTPIFVRGELMRRFRAREILQLVNVDILGEGVDVPAIEVVSMARPTHSFQLYSQQFGRALRPMLSDSEAAGWGALTDAERLARLAQSSKPQALIIDHVQNYLRLGLPDRPRFYTLDNTERKSRGSSDEIPLRTCLNELCMQPYERILPACPHCGTVPIPRGRSLPEFVDGDMTEISPDVLRKLRGEIHLIDSAPYVPKHLMNTPAAGAIIKNHKARQESQRKLRHAMTLWGGWRLSADEPLWVAQRRFFHRFGMDIMNAQALSTKEALALEAEILKDIAARNVVDTTTGEIYAHAT